MSIENGFLKIASDIKGLGKEQRRLATLESTLLDRVFNPQRKNFIINGGFDLAQRNPSTAPLSVGVAKQYVVDRWYTQRSGAGATVNISNTAFVPGAAPYPTTNEPVNIFRYNQTVAGSGMGSSFWRHHIEDVRSLAGQDATLSFVGRADAARQLGFLYIQDFGTGGAPSAQVVSAVSLFNLTTDWQAFLLNIPFPSIAGKTFGTNNDSSLIIDFRVVALNTVQRIDMAQVQLEPGNIATPFIKDTQSELLAKCQRYYQKSFPQSVAPASAAGVTGAYGSTAAFAGAVGNILGSQPLPVIMRKTPAVTTYNYVAAGAEMQNAVTGTPGTTTVSNGYTSDRVIGFNVTGAAGWLVGQAVIVNWSADAEF